MKRIFSFLVALIMLISMCACETAPADETTVCPTEPTISVLLTDTCLLVDHRFEYLADLPIEDIEVVIGELEAYIALLEETKAGLPTDHADYEQAAFMIDEALNELEEIIHCYQVDLEELLEEARWARKMEEYPVMTTIWLYMRDHFGWSKELCAGVIGNILAEAGGGYTMKIPTKIAKTGPYGLCQWLGGRKNEIVKRYGYDATVEEQLEFMYDEIFGTDGVKQQITDSQRTKLLNSTSPEDAAIKFCRWFERPGGTGNIRKKYARKVYEYFEN